MTNAELLDFVRVAIAARRPTNIGNDPVDPLSAIASLRLISGEIRRRAWADEDRERAARIADKADTVAEEIARREGWYEEREDGLDQALREWIGRTGPRRFIWHGEDEDD